MGSCVVGSYASVTAHSRNNTSRILTLISSTVMSVTHRSGTTDADSFIQIDDSSSFAPTQQNGSQADTIAEQIATEHAVDALIAESEANARINAAERDREREAACKRERAEAEATQAEKDQQMHQLDDFIHSTGPVDVVELRPEAAGKEPLRYLTSSSYETAAEAATRIQACARGKATRDNMPQRLASAGRRRSVQKGLAALMMEKEEYLKTRPLERFRLLRNEVMGRISSVIEALSSTLTEEEAAVLRIQCAQRGRVARYRVGEKRTEKRKEAAAIKIQAVQRGKMGRRSCIQKRENWLETQMVGNSKRQPKMKSETTIHRESIADSLDAFAAMATGELVSTRYKVDVVLGEERGCSEPHTAWITAVSVHEEMVFTGGNDNLVFMTDFSSLDPAPRGCCRGHEKEVTGVIAIPGLPEHPAHEVLSCSWDGTVRKWRIPKETGDSGDLSVGMEVSRWCHPAGVTDACVVYSEGLAEGNDLYAACDDGHVCRWHLGAVGRQEWKHHMKQRYGPRGAACTLVRVWTLPDLDEHLLVGNIEGRVTQYDVTSGDVIRHIQTPCLVRCLAVSQGHCFTSGEDGVVRRWNLSLVDDTGGTQVGEYGKVEYGHYAGICCLVVQEDMLLTGGADRTIREWSVASGAEVTRYRGHHDTPLALYEEAGTIYSAGCDLTVRAWRPSQHTVPHVPYYRDNTMDAQWEWPLNGSHQAGKNLYHYPREWCPGSQSLSNYVTKPPSRLAYPHRLPSRDGKRLTGNNASRRTEYDRNNLQRAEPNEYPEHGFSLP